ncbi:phosphopantetheine-protein transferase [Rhizobium sp. PDO1-076]|nr:phosphopantetheine-protein transferase [Rhizobium sp. PDO1-076]
MPVVEPLADIRQVDIWNWSLEIPASEDAVSGTCLSQDELERAQRFVKPRDTRRYMAGRAGLRSILGDYLSIAPKDVRFSYTEFGKPYLDTTGERPLEFNLSHSADQALLAVSRHFTLGVDVEEIKPIAEDVAGHFFSAAECTELRAYPTHEHMAAFYRCWTRKEAFVKAHGAGLSLALDCFDVSLSASPQQILRRLDPAVGAAQDWMIMNIDVAEGFCAAVAVLNSGQHVHLRYCGDWRARPRIASIT